MIHVLAVQERSISSAVCVKHKMPMKIFIKGCDEVVELDQFKYTLNGYEGPLEELRDSL